MLTVFAFAVPLLALKLSPVGRGYELDGWPTAKIGLKVSLRSMAVSLGFRQCKTIIMPLIPISYSSVSCCRRCLRCAKRCSFCSVVSCWRLLLRCSRWIWSRHSPEDFHFANYRFSSRKLQTLISQTTDFHFANYRFSFRFVPFRFVSFCFAPFRFANYSKPVNTYFYKYFFLFTQLINMNSNLLKNIHIFYVI